MINNISNPIIAFRFEEGQGLGNQLWNYAACRSIAQHIKCPFKVFALESFKGNDLFRIDEEINPSQASIPNEFSDVWSIFNEQLYYDERIDYIGSDFDSRAFSIDRPVVIKGLFQSEKYFAGDLSLPSLYFRLLPSVLHKYNIHIDPYTAILNIRGGEYKRHKRFNLPKSYWLEAMNIMKENYDISNFIIVTDDKKYAESLFPWIQVISGDIAKCYLYLYFAKNLIVSNSSFSYFPIRTSPYSGKQNIIAPAFWARYNSNMNIWASTANVYEGWSYLAKDGCIYDSKNAELLAAAARNYYNKNLNIVTNRLPIMNKNLFAFMPKSFRVRAKQTLSIFMPQYF